MNKFLYSKLSDFKKVLLLIIFALFLHGGIAYGTVYTVTNTVDGIGLDQLRGALVDAGNTAGTHTVNISAGTYYIDLGHIPFGTVGNIDITINGAGIGNTIIDARGQSRGFVLNPNNNQTNVKIAFNGMTIQNCASTSTTGGGAVAAAGGTGNAYGFENCLFYNNNSNHSTSFPEGGAIFCQDASLSVTNCSFSSNTSKKSSGGAISYRCTVGSRGNVSLHLNIANSKFSFNTAPGSGSGGGAIYVSPTAGNGGSFSSSVTECTFTSNSARVLGGAIVWQGNSEAASVNINYNRFLGNTAVDYFPSAVYIGRFKLEGNNLVFAPSDQINAKNNWWGCNLGSGGCADQGNCPNGFDAALTPYLQLKTTLSSGSICYGSGNSVQVATGFTSNSANEPIDPANLGAFVGRPVSFVVPGGMGNMSGAQTTIQANGLATGTFTSNGTFGTANLYAISDNPSTTASLAVNGPGTWLGTSSNDWYLPANWCGGAIPTASTNVLIPAGTPYAPTIKFFQTAAVANNITIASGATLSLGTYATLDVKGNFTNNGNFIANAEGAFTLFSGAGDQTVPGADYELLSIAGGGIKTLTGDASLNLQFGFGGSAKMALGDNTLTFNTNTDVPSADANRYFITNGTGGLKKKNIGDFGFTFPIGSATSYMPVVLSNSGTPDHFTARVGDGVYTSYTGNLPQGSAVTNKAVNSTWYISEDVPGGSNVGLALYWNAADELTSFDRGDCYVAHYTNGSWNSITSGAASGSNPYFMGRSGITSFSPFAVTNPNSALPVTLSRFDAVREGNTALLSWSTTGETNSDRFEIERSTNGKNWQTIGAVKSSGESKNLLDYQFVDLHPLLSQENLYRLRMVDRDAGDRDGTFAYSRIRSVKFESPDRSVVYPNPVSDKLFIQDFAAVSDVRILDLKGNVVHHTDKVGNDGIGVGKLPAGMHIVEIKWYDGKKTTQKVVIE